MKTIAEIAAEIGVSKQAIQKKINREPLYTSIQQYIAMVGGTKYIEVGGIDLIKSAYQAKDRQPVADNVYTNQPTTTDNHVYSVLKETIEILRQQLEVKDEQLKVKDEQILNLSEINRNLSESINVANKNELAETIIDGNKKLIGETQVKERGGIFKIFSRKK